MHDSFTAPLGNRARAQTRANTRDNANTRYTAPVRRETRTQAHTGGNQSSVAGNNGLAALQSQPQHIL